MWEELASASASESSELVATAAATLGGDNGLLAINQFLAAHPNLALIASFALMVWIFAIKGVALWRAAKASHQIWFVLILIFNTFGLLELIYIFYLSKQNWTDKKQKFLSFLGIKNGLPAPKDNDKN